MSYSISDKKIVRLLMEVCLHAGLKHVVISPGSRNAPMTLSFAAMSQFKCYSVVDERSAGFFALGLAQQLHEPVALVCTSGSALLNYAPAISEAYYQSVPLMVLSADRPAEWIDQADGQTIRQLGVFSNFIKYACQLPAEIEAADDEWYANRLLNEAFYHVRHLVSGPVHINIPFREPLYGRQAFVPSSPRLIAPLLGNGALTPEAIGVLANEWQQHERVMILVGQHNTSIGAQLASYLAAFAQMPQVAILKESLSNMVIPGAFDCIDAMVSTIGEAELDEFRPTLLITFDGAVVSKMVKGFLRGCKNLAHWHISPVNQHLDTYRHLSRGIETSPLSFFEQVKDHFSAKDSPYRHLWNKRRLRSQSRHNQYLESTGWCDLKAFEIMGEQIPANWQLHLSNSSPIRYAQLFEPFYRVDTYCNRGTSGIDGCTSTAVGACVANDRPVLLMTGDLSFLYDSNALWNKYLSPKLRIIVINNGGGDIFRFISGEGAKDEMDEFFVAAHQQPMAHLAMMFGLDYLVADSEASLKSQLPLFFAESQRPVMLEVKTFDSANAAVLKSYFKNLKDLL